jgi:hypothetical protein
MKGRNMVEVAWASAPERIANEVANWPAELERQLSAPLAETIERQVEPNWLDGKCERLLGMLDRAELCPPPARGRVHAMIEPVAFVQTIAQLRRLLEAETKRADDAAAKVTEAPGMCRVDMPEEYGGVAVYQNGRVVGHLRTDEAAASAPLKLHAPVQVVEVPVGTETVIVGMGGVRVGQLDLRCTGQNLQPDSSPASPPAPKPPARVAPEGHEIVMMEVCVPSFVAKELRSGKVTRLDGLCPRAGISADLPPPAFLADLARLRGISGAY